MSTPIRQVEVSPEDPKFYAPPRWRRGEVEAPSIQPSLRSAEFLGPQAYADWTSHHGDEGLADERGSAVNNPVADALPKPRWRRSARQGNGGVRATALAIAAGVVLWTAVCIVLALGRLDVINFEQLRNGLPSVKDTENSVIVPPQPTDVVLAETPREVVAPTLAVADAIGESNAALPLAIRVTNVAPGTTIMLGGLAAGTTLSSGAVAGEGQWRIALDDLPSVTDGLQNTLVMPPSDFVGLMTVVAELRGSADQAIVSAPVRLTWRQSGIDFREVVKPTPSALPVPTDDSAAPKEAMLSWRDEPAASEPALRPKVRKHRSRASKTHIAKNQNVEKMRLHRAASAARDPQATVTPWREVNSPYAYDISADRRAGRRSSWNDDVQSIIDRSWQRCTFNCDRDILR
jgi:hypothetical protein